MRKEFLQFHKASIGEKEICEVVKTLRSGWLSCGPKTRKFEEEFKNFTGAKYAAAVSSCTAALHLALAAIGLKKDDEVIVPTMTFTATAEVVTYFGAKPVFVDCDPTTLLVDPLAIKEKITSKTRAIIPVHYAGQACDIDGILALARKYGIKVIWDAAHALPTYYKGKKVGTFPDITCFSFYATKTITTGEGGAVATDSKQYYEKMKILSMHGMDKDAWKRYSKQGSWFYQIIVPGFKYNMTDIGASLGLVQLRRCESLRKKRELIAKRYSKAFYKSDVLQPLAYVEDGLHSWHLYVIKLDLRKISINRNRFIEELKKRNIGSSVHFIPLHLHPYWKKNYGLKQSDYPNATKAYQQILSLPIFPDMSEKDISDVTDAVFDIVKKFAK